MVLVWAPFLIAEPGTLAAARFGVPVAAASGLHFLDVAASATPSWVRPAQFLLGAALAAAAIARQGWASVILPALAVRILLDPAVHAYYTSGIVLGTLVHDLAGSRARVPRLTMLAVAMLYLPQVAAKFLGAPPLLLGGLRVGFVLCAVVVVLCCARQDAVAQRTPLVSRQPGTASAGRPSGWERGRRTAVSVAAALRERHGRGGAGTRAGGARP